MSTGRRTLALVAVTLTACTSPQPGEPPSPVRAGTSPVAVIPLPSSIQLTEGQSFLVDSATAVYVDEVADSSVTAVASYLAAMLGPVAPSQVRRLPSGITPPPKSIHLALASGPAGTAGEGYQLNVTASGVSVSATSAAGLFYGAQTIRQLLPASVEHPAALRRSLRLPAGRISDAPRFEWRGMMLDVSRHFLPPRDVKRFIDLLALYKLNRLHLHLSDDQGWRIDIKSRPELARIGGSTQVGGGPGGYYTQPEYSDIVAYAARRFITIVPEIDMPGHTNAALASYPDLNCNKVAPPLYTGIRVGFSALCVDSAAIYPVLEDIVREISALTPGRYFHIGGDEVEKLTPQQYRRFVERMQTMVNANGKQMIGWGEIAPANLSATTVIQNWKKDSSAIHAARGGKVILSPATKVYLDQKYDTTTVLGLNWANYNSVRISYDWDPATFIAGVPETAVLGVEAPLWSETLIKSEDFEYMAFPRLLAVAEIGWTLGPRRQWEDFNRRLQLQSARLDALGVNRPR
ncbi:MAG TPA: beta-N-acetylhexosaminidase [Gemmatimonadaceae bacterium]|nr:beta-N-acetylhexosaminidase [Gemmatimonadaceae bacterium]